MYLENERVKEKKKRKNNNKKASKLLLKVFCCMLSFKSYSKKYAPPVLECLNPEHLTFQLLPFCTTLDFQAPHIFNVLQLLPKRMLLLGINASTEITTKQAPTGILRGL